ncbi:MAG: hypothetical protein ABR577_08850 [Pyrinomonadaceae bacterium]
MDNQSCLPAAVEAPDFRDKTNRRRADCPRQATPTSLTVAFVSFEATLPQKWRCRADRSAHMEIQRKLKEQHRPPPM